MVSTRYSSNHSGCNSGSNTGGNGSSSSSSGNGNGNGLLNPFKATKKFFKKIYDTATLPSRLHSKVLASSVIEQNEIPTTSISSSSKYSFFDASYSLELPDDDEPSYQYDYDIINSNTTNSCIIANHDSNSAPLIMKPVRVIEDTMNNDSGLSRSISSNDSQKTSSGDFRSWNEVFNHLKREMVLVISHN
uniref:Suppressor protein SRP40-like n=1 Tax=Loa loa TaxID=7209 RepID=A0A1I7VAU0_LOALO